MARQSKILQLVRGGWRLLDGVRRFLHLVVLLVLLAIVVIVALPEPIIVPESAALVITPKGALVDQLSGDALDRALSELRGGTQQETLLRDLIDAIDRATNDSRIGALYLRLDAFGGAGLSKLQDLGDAIAAFKRSGKPVVAAGDSFTRDQYYLAAHADQVFLHPMGAVIIEGYSRFIPYFKSALESLYIDYSVWSAGDYKSFTEPYTRDDMSPADREASALYLDVLWREYSADVVAARGLDEDAMNRLASEFSGLLRMANGDAAQMALDFGLVDELMTRGEVNQHLVEIVGTQNGRNEQFAGIGFVDYLGAVRDSPVDFGIDNKLAVLTLAGQIYDGDQAPGSVGGDSAAQLVRQVRQDENVKALVLRVDSPGGSAFASEVILNELEAFQATGRPLVVSMGSVAASGGYWVSMTADEIWASPTTITGSIGVGALVPTFPRALDRLGIHIDGVGTNSLAGQFSVLRGIGEDADQYYAQSVSHLYEQFVAKVADGRGRSQADIEDVAQGRVWAGTHALDSGLVDRLGSLDEAIRSAAGLAGLETDSYRVEYVERELSFSESLALQFAQAVSPVLEFFSIDSPWSQSIKRVVDAVLDPLEFLERQNDPRGLYSYCFCDVR